MPLFGSYGGQIHVPDYRNRAAEFEAAGDAALGRGIGDMVAKYRLNKEKRAKLTGEIEALLQTNPDYVSEATMTGDEASDKKSMSEFLKFTAGDLNMAGLEGLAGKLARLEKQKSVQSALAKEAAMTGYYERAGQPDPLKALQAAALRKFSGALDAPRGGGMGDRPARGPGGLPGAAGAAGAAGATPLPPPGQLPSPPPPGAAAAAPTPMPPRTPAVTQAMAPSPRPINRNKFENLSLKEKRLLKLAGKDPVGAAMMDEAMGGVIGKLRARTREWGRNEIGIAQEVLDKDGLATGSVLIPTSPTTQLVQSKPEAKPDLYEVKDIADGSRQQYMGNNKWVELVADEFEDRPSAEETAKRFGGKVTYNDKTKGFNVEMPAGFANQMEEITEPAFEAPVFYHRASNQFFTKDAKGKMGQMTEDAVTVVGQDNSGDDIVVINGGSTPYVRNAQGLTAIQPRTMRPEARMTMYNHLLAPLQRDQRLIDYIRAKDQSDQDEETTGTGKNREFHYDDRNGIARTWKYDQSLEDNIEKMATYLAEMQAVRLAFPLQR